MKSATNSGFSPAFYRQHDKFIFFKFVNQPVETGYFCSARGAPTRPECKEHHRALIITEHMRRTIAFCDNNLRNRRVSPVWDGNRRPPIPPRLARWRLFGNRMIASRNKMNKHASRIFMGPPLLLSDRRLGVCRTLRLRGDFDDFFLMQGGKNGSQSGLREYFDNAAAGKKGKNRAVRRKSDRLLNQQ